MIEQINTIDGDDVEFEVNFHDTIQTYKEWIVNVRNMRDSGRYYWWRCRIMFNDTDGIIPTGEDKEVVQHFFAPTYQALKAQIIDFIARYFNF